ncbi:hypothetical protein F4U02_03630 [Acinetobacter haemolyticus]|uniref:hypothetical protein n=1 Tax=Acinetobacter haemolyticus TaxID=29430 RepID=UPI00129872B7|nr:hypothetical protein [Acinetobacter haemolyticus]MQZ30108.1 hypothetical protein [Acinetobacter haemolyticus]
MKNKFLTTILYISLALLTACGDGNDNQTDFNGKQKLDYKKVETTEIISKSVVNLSHISNNSILYITSITQSIYERVTNLDFSCGTGTVKINSDNSITLNNCKNFNYPFQDTPFSGTVSGTIQSISNNTTASLKNELKLSNINIDLSEKSIIFNGKIIQTSSSTYDLIKQTYEVDQSTLELVEKLDNKNHYLYNLKNYQFISNYYPSSSHIEDFTKGEIDGEFNGNIFSVNFASILNFSTLKDLLDLKPSSANVEITDLYNQRNAISIHQATNGTALVSTYADGKLVQTFSQDWNEF